MGEYLYRYIGFESFVGLVQNQALSFVLLNAWDDPMEGNSMKDLLVNIDDSIQRILLCVAYYKTYGQCWSKKAESDAMWRINSHENHAVRIKVLRDDLFRLDGVEAIDVQYTDAPFKMGNDIHTSLLRALSQKRTAFAHEEEVRLIKRYRFADAEDAEKHVKAFLAANEHPQTTQIIENLFPGQSIESQVKQLVGLLNLGNGQLRTHDVSFADIPNFIQGVLVHPLASNWYVKIAEEFCRRNQIPFEGKSQLYALPKNN